MKLTIIVPVYNVEKYLRKCLDSLINQTLKEIEIIFINDGSTDNSLKILKQYEAKDSRIKVIDNVHSGQSVSRNIGIKLAKGEYLGFVDADDWVDLDYFEKLYNAAEKNNCDIACAGFKRTNGWRASTRKNFISEIVCSDIDSKIKFDKLPNHNYIWNKIYKRISWLNLGFEFTPGKYFEDVALLIQILYKMGSFVTVPNTYYYYRKNSSSTVATRSLKHSEDLKWAKSEMINFAHKYNIKLSGNKNFEKKEYIKLFNFTIIKIYYFNNIKKYKLLGFIPFLSVESC